ncbi:ribonuclease J [Actinomycetota bacterium]|nr:ribonuclease J [Actinomycetota bacterium]
MKDKLDRIEAVVITHGHEDHIGAIPYLLKMRPDIPVVGSKLSLALITKRLEEHKINPRTVEVREGEEVRFGPYLLSFLPVNHSIPDALAVFVETSAGNVLDTGDFKMDQTPIDGRLTDLRAFGDASEIGVDLFMVDSTNALRDGFVKSEKTIGPVLHQLFENTPEGVIFATTFASNIHRIIQIVDAAIANNRKIALLGRSLVTNMEIARNLRMIDFPEDVLIDIKDVDKYNPHQLCILCTGSQGENLAALSRMGRGEHPRINITDQDTIIMASSNIPGNEKSISGMLNDIEAIGAQVYDSQGYNLHCSGHACKGELQYIYNVVKPKNVLPIHGEVRHLRANAAIAHSVGLDDQSVVTVTNGGVIDLESGFVKVVGKLENNYLFVEGLKAGSINEYDIKDRLTLSNEGVVVVTATVDLECKKVVADPKIVSKASAIEHDAFNPLYILVKSALNKAMQDEGVKDIKRLNKVVRRTVGKFVGLRLKRSPMIVPVVQSVN